MQKQLNYVFNVLFFLSCDESKHVFDFYFLFHYRARSVFHTQFLQTIFKNMVSLKGNRKTFSKHQQLLMQETSRVLLLFISVDYDYRFTSAYKKYMGRG